MVFLAFFVFIFVIIISLNIYDSYNINTMKQYLDKSLCSNLVYSKGSYKGLCSNKIILIENKINISLPKDAKEYQYKNIKSIKKINSYLLINDKNKIKFNSQKVLNAYYIQIKKKIKQ